ncbi:MAG TPA: phage portal protein [Stellaceae bacterium]|jgi:HK97 family phage portal protein|nr:phage portal protein [Stellaceae bacterium]
MPRFTNFVREFFGAEQKNADRVNRYEGFQSDGAIVLQDSRGTRKAEIPAAETKSAVVGDNPLAIYKPTGAKSVDAAKAMANFTGWTYAAVNAISSEVANIEFRLFRVTGNEHEELDDHPLLTLLDGVNEQMTGIELKYISLAHLELTGNAYWFLDGVKSETGEPTAIHPLNPGRMRVKLDKSAFPYKISHYEYTFDGNVYTFQPYQIVHIKYPDPNDPFVGIGVPQTIPSWIDSDNYAMEYNRKFFINGANIGLFLQTETNVEGNIDRIRKGFANRHEGVENAHKVPVLPKGVELKHTGLSQRDMDFANLTDRTRDRILAGFRVSKTILGTAESETNRATAETADYVFSKRTIKPKMLLVVSYLNEFLVPRYGDDLYLTFIDPTPDDKTARTAEMQAAVGSMPVMTQNEARKQYMGLGPIEGGDRLMMPSTMEPAGTTDQVEGEDATPQLAKTAEGWKTKATRVRTGGKTAHSASSQMRRALMSAFKKQIDGVPQFQVKHVTELSHDEYMEHYKRFDRRTQDAVAELHKTFESINAKQKKDVLENLPDATGVEKAIGDLFDLKEWIGITIDLATPILTTLAKDEAAAALAMIGAQHQDILANDSTREALDRGISKMARSYNETTLQQLKDKLGEKLTQEGGTNLTELTEAVDGVYSFADERRAGMIAQTESYRASNFANKEAWRQSGVVKTVKWYTAEDQRVCEFCGTMEAQGPIPVDDSFADAGDKIIGTDGGTYTADYGVVDAPPLHPLCRCYLRPEEISIG